MRRKEFHLPVLVPELLSLFSKSSAFISGSPSNPLLAPLSVAKKKGEERPRSASSPADKKRGEERPRSSSSPADKKRGEERPRLAPLLASPPTRLLDCTFGRGGHSLAFLKQFPDLQITALDCDHQAVEYASSLKEVHEGRIHLIKTNFFHFPEFFHQQSSKLDRQELKKNKENFHQQTHPQSEKLKPKDLTDTQLNQQTSPQSEKFDRQELKKNKENLHQQTHPQIEKLKPKDLTDTQLNQQSEKFDLILMDLGPSSPQLDEAERGFSFQESGPLDMRMDRASPLKAEEIINHWSEKELIKLFQLYGEIRRPQRVVANIIQQRRKTPITDTLQLSRLIQKSTGRRSKNRHPATLWFLALRIAVNQELEGLKACLPGFLPLLKRGGCLAIISFHSLEDRIVKKTFRQFAEEEKEAGKHLKTKHPECLTPVWTKKAIRPSLKERKQNPRSRSAKLRIFQKTIKSLVPD